MKLTEEKLREIIREELQASNLNEGRAYAQFTRDLLEARKAIVKAAETAVYSGENYNKVIDQLKDTQKWLESYIRNGIL